MNREAMLNNKAAAGHSGQYNTARRSSTKLSKIARYSASFEFFVALPFPDLEFKNTMIVHAAFVADSNPVPYSRISSMSLSSRKGSSDCCLP
jgi:hypothetical protein